MTNPERPWLIFCWNNDKPLRHGDSYVYNEPHKLCHGSPIMGGKNRVKVVNKNRQTKHFSFSFRSRFITEIVIRSMIFSLEEVLPSLRRHTYQRVPCRLLYDWRPQTNYRFDGKENVIVEVHSRFRQSSYPLKHHIELGGITSACFIDIPFWVAEHFFRVKQETSTTTTTTKGKQTPPDPEEKTSNNNMCPLI